MKLAYNESDDKYYVSAALPLSLDAVDASDSLSHPGEPSLSCFLFLFPPALFPGANLPEGHVTTFLGCMICRDESREQICLDVLYNQQAHGMKISRKRQASLVPSQQHFLDMKQVT